MAKSEPKMVSFGPSLALSGLTSAKNLKKAISRLILSGKWPLPKNGEGRKALDCLLREEKNHLGSYE